ncbi:MAG: glutamyl-tRNA reductase [Thermoprotei archaeon]
MLEHLAVLTLNHKYYPIYRIERACFSDVKDALNNLSHVENVLGLVILQTCNRIELYLHYVGFDTLKNVINRWEELVDDRNLENDIIIMHGSNVVYHLFRVTAGLESMALGENEILHQVRDAYKLASENKVLSRLMRSLFEEALRVGKEVRAKTILGHVRVSLAEVAVNVIEHLSEDLNDKTIIVIGAGETGTSVVKSLSRKSVRKFTILIANRTYEKAVELANNINGIALHLSELDRYLNVADIVFVTTSAPHFILTKERIQKCMEIRRKPLLIVDLSVPRNVDPEIKNITGVQVITIDDLKSHTDSSRILNDDLEKADHIIRDAVNKFVFKWENSWVEDVLADLYKYAESIRKNEVDEALRMLGDLGKNERVRIVLDNMSRVLVKRLLHFQSDFLRKNRNNSSINLKVAEENLY